MGRLFPPWPDMCRRRVEVSTWVLFEVNEVILVEPGARALQSWWVRGWLRTLPAGPPTPRGWETLSLFSLSVCFEVCVVSHGRVGGCSLVVQCDAVR